MAALLMEATKKAGALDVQYKDCFGRKTALQVACRQNIPSTVEKLLALGANAALPDDVNIMFRHMCTHPITYSMCMV